jgi:hypothetical protein
VRILGCNSPAATTDQILWSFRKATMLIKNGFTYGYLPGHEPVGYFTSDDGYCTCSSHEGFDSPLHKGECEASLARRVN